MNSLSLRLFTTHNSKPTKTLHPSKHKIKQLKRQKKRRDKKQMLKKLNSIRGSQKVRRNTMINKPESKTLIPS